MTERWRRVAIGALALVAVQAAAVGIYLGVQRGRSARGPTFSAERLRAAPPAPDIAVELPGGRRKTLSGLGGRVVLVHFWATWCPPCVEELPGLLATARELDGVELIAVSMDDDWEIIGRFFGGDVPPEVVRSADHRRTNALFDLVSLPDTYLAANGRLIVRYGGTREWTSESARQHLREMVTEVGNANAWP